MSGTQEVDAIVLRHYPLADADLIAVLFSPETGQIRAVAKGAKKPKSRLGAALEPLTRVRLGYRPSPSQGLAKVVHCEVVKSYLSDCPSPEKVFVYEYLSEIIQEFCQENNPNPLLFRLFVAVLDALEDRGVREALVRYLEFWVLRLAGFLPEYGHCSRCGRCVKDTGFFVRPDAWEPRCESCSRREGTWVGSAAAAWLAALSENSPAAILGIPFPGEAAGDLERLSQRLLDGHLEKRLKSRDFARDLFRDGRRA